MVVQLFLYVSAAHAQVKSDQVRWWKPDECPDELADSLEAAWSQPRPSRAPFEAMLW